HLWTGVTNRTRVISVSHITSPTAMRFPLADICRRARAAGILTAIDGAHATGQIPLNLETIGADYYIGNFHKWFCAPKSAGFLYARAAHQDSLYPLVVSWGWLNGKTPVEKRSWKGTEDIAAYLTLPDTLAFRENHHWDTIITSCHTLAVEWRARLIDELGGKSTSPDDNFVQLFTVELPPCDPIAVQDALYHDYRVEVPIIPWGGRQLVRVSVQAYNTADDLARLVEALGAVLREQNIN
ncbi:MAG: aminotransferase class V-fold PLP-dependent enzyme, partial [Chloroflexota bacterium]